MPRRRPDVPPETPRDTASIGWRSVAFGKGTFDIRSDHPNRRGWQIYELGQKGFWAVPDIVDWDRPVREDPRYASAIAAMLGFLCPGEKAAVTGASMISLRVPSEEAKFYFVEQAMEESKHYDAMRRLIPKITGRPMDPVKPSLRLLYTFGVLDPDDVAFMMGNINIIGEHLANQIFMKIKRVAIDETTTTLLHLIGKDESRHIAAGRRFFVEVYDQYRASRRKIMAKNLATLVLLGHAGRDLVRPMDTLGIDLGDILHTMFDHYDDVTRGLPAFPEQALLDALLRLVRRSTRPGLAAIRNMTDAEGRLEPKRFLTACERALTSPRELRAMFS